MCSQEGAKLLVKAWVELMHYLAGIWVEARTPLRGWKPAVTEPGFQWYTDRLAAVPVVNTRVLKRVEGLEREIPPIGCRGHWFTQAFGSGRPGDGHYGKAKALGLAVLLHWKGYLVVQKF